MNRTDGQKEKHAPLLAANTLGLTDAVRKMPDTNLEVQISEMRPHHQAAFLRLNRVSVDFTTAGYASDCLERFRLWQSGLLEGLIVRASRDALELGVVGAMLFARSADALRVEAFMLEPRARGYRVERQMLTLLGAIAQCRRLPQLAVNYHFNGRNVAAQKFLHELQGEPVTLENGGTTFRFSAVQIASLGTDDISTVPLGFVSRAARVPK